IDRLATRVLEIENGSITSYEGNYEDYLRKKEMLAAAEASSSAAGRSDPGTRTAGPASHKGTTSVGPKTEQKGNGDLAPASTWPASSNTIILEGGFDGLDGSAQKAAKSRRLNPIKQKQMEDRCAFL